MELQSLSFPITELPAIFAFLVFVLFLLRKQRNGGEKKTAPSAPGAWPVIGHLRLFGNNELPHVMLANIAKKMGPIFSLKVGVHPIVVVSTPELAKECFTTNDKIFLNRSKFMASEHLGINYAMFFLSPYGPYWRRIRKITVMELLSERRIKMLGHIRISEVKTSIKEIYGQWAKNISSGGSDNRVLLEMKRWFGDITLKVVVRTIAGRRYSSEEEEGARFHKGLREMFEYLGMFFLSDALPYLRWLDLGGHEKEMKRIANEIDSIVEKWLDEHKQRKNEGLTNGEQDFMDVMLSLPTDDILNYDADTINKATCLTILAGAADTTTITLTWCLSLLLNNRDVLKKAQEELDTHVGKERQVDESDIKNLVYIQSIIKETLRLYPAAPLSAPHESMEDCTVGGYHVPKGTRLLVNLWNIHHDPSIWPDPYAFKPERFLTTHKDIDVRGQHFELIPFSSGRRMCPGLAFALQVMNLTLASLLQGFEFDTIANEPVDMSESIGITNLKATPLQVLVTPRMPSHLYI